MFLNLTNANKKTLSSSVYAILFALVLRLKQIVEILKGNKEVLEEVKEIESKRRNWRGLVMAAMGAG